MKKIISTNFKSVFFFTMLLASISSRAQFAIIFDWEHTTYSSDASRWGTKTNTWIAPDGNIIHTGRDAVGKWTPSGDEF